MNDVALFPDATATAISWLRELNPDLNIGTDYQADTSAPVVVLRRTGGLQRTLVTDQAYVSVDVWPADGWTAEQDGHDLAQRLRAQLKNMTAHLIGGVAVYRVADLGGLARFPDPATERERWTFSLAVTVRGRALT